jgi:hypothetical protein
MQKLNDRATENGLALSGADIVAWTLVRECGADFSLRMLLRVLTRNFW